MNSKTFSGSPQSTQIGQGKQYKEMFPRIQEQKRPKTPEDQILKKHPKGPGIFFDMQKGIQYQKIENTKKTIMRNSSQTQLGQNPSQQVIEAIAAAAVQNAGGFTHHSDKHSQRLYSPYEYLHYATKINFSKESYLSALTQLGYKNVNNLNAKPYNDIMNKTQGIIQKSYSLKYLGVIDGNMGILSKRVKLSNAPIQQTTDSKKQNSDKSKKNKRMKQVAKENDISQHANISVIPSDYRPDLYNSYLITSYSLPKYLKPITKEKNTSMIEDKQRLEKWHADQLRQTSNFMQSDIKNDEGNQSIQYAAINNSISASMSMNAGLTNYIGKIKPKRQNSQRQHSPSQQQGNQNHELGNKYYAEVPEEGLSYAIIDKSKEPVMNQSYSRLINTISKRNAEQQKTNLIEDGDIIPQAIRTARNQLNNVEQNQKSNSQNPSIKFTQNQQFHDRYDHIAKYLEQKQKV